MNTNNFQKKLSTNKRTIPCE